MHPVVHVVEDFKIGGQEQVIYDLVRSQNSNRYPASVLCLSRDGEMADRLRAAGGEVNVLGIVDYHSLSALRKVIAFFREKKIQVVHTHGIPAGVLGRIAAFLAGIPCIVCHVHSTCYELLPRHQWKERCLARLSHRVICVSRAVERSVKQCHWVGTDRICCVENGVALPSQPLIPAQLPWRKNCRKLLAIGALKHHKGHRYLLQAMQQIPDADLCLAGDGPLRIPLQRMSESLGIDHRVHFLGLREDVHALLAASELLILPSLREGHPITLLEAMVCKVAVVASDVGGVAEILDQGKAGKLIAPARSDELVAGIRNLLENEPLKLQMIAAAHHRQQERYHADLMTQRIEMVYDSVLYPCHNV